MGCSPLVAAFDSCVKASIRARLIRPGSIAISPANPTAASSPSVAVYVHQRRDFLNSIPMPVAIRP
ncbi:MAG TPA: hypothetical protein VJR26_10785, partial [Candidatus Acidoferrales bacterium]|nr:hypothetical protein [Candidatus Acidoferrales bacterium]